MYLNRIIYSLIPPYDVALEKMKYFKNRTKLDYIVVAHQMIIDKINFVLPIFVLRNDAMYFYHSISGYRLRILCVCDRLIGVARPLIPNICWTFSGFQKVL